MDTTRAAILTHGWGDALRDRTDGREEGRLLAALASGDREAAERLVERTYRIVYALLRRLCGEPDLAADLTQETYRKAYNTFLNPLRRPRRLVPLEEKHEATVADPAPSADETFGLAVAGDRLRRAVLALPDDLRFTVTALFWGDLPVREIALHEGVTTVAIRKRLKRALAALAAALE